MGISTLMIEIPIIWKKPHHSENVFHVGIISTLLDHFLKRYGKRLQIEQVMIDFEMPKNAAGVSNKTFVIKLHLKLHSGLYLRAESEEKTIEAAMKNITREIENQSRTTDRQKHEDNTRRLG